MFITMDYPGALFLAALLAINPVRAPKPKLNKHNIIKPVIKLPKSILTNDDILYGISGPRNMPFKKKTRTPKIRAAIAPTSVCLSSVRVK